MISLHPYQVPQRDMALAALSRGRVFIDTSTTGSGKTYIALAVAEHLQPRHKLLVIAPKASHTQWRRVAETSSADLLAITNPESLIRSPRNPIYNSKSKTWHLPDVPVLVVFDEIHRGASGVDSSTTEAVARLKAYRNTRLYAMSATLAETPLKMRATGYWLGLHKFNITSFYDFCLRHNCKWEMVPTLENRLLARQGNRVKKRMVFTRNAAAAEDAMRRIREAAGPAMHGITVEDIPDFPTQMFEIVLLDLNKQDQRDINQAYKDMSDRLRKDAKSELAQITRDRERIEFIKAKYIAGEVAKLREDGFAVPVFLNFTSARERVASFLISSCSSSTNPLRDPIPQIYGGQPPDERQAAIDAFQANEPGADCILVMAQAGGVALSLHDVHKTKPRVSVTSPSFSASELLQVFGRIRRDGGTHALQRIILVAGTVEERIATSLERKLDNLDTLNDSDLNPFSQTPTQKDTAT